MPNNAKSSVEKFRAVLMKHNATRIGDIHVDHQSAFAEWRRGMASVSIWFGNFAVNGDYSGAINAAMALGRMDALHSGMPENVIPLDDMVVVHNLCTDMWNDIQNCVMVPRKEVTA